MKLTARLLPIDLKQKNGSDVISARLSHYDLSCRLVWHTALAESAYQ